MTLVSLVRESLTSLWGRPAPTVVVEPAEDPLGLADAPPDVRRLIREGRYCRILMPGDGITFDDESRDYAWQAVLRSMAIVPEGLVTLSTDLAVATSQGFEFEPASYENIPVDPIFLDRDLVTNRDFAKFVAAGGYRNEELWPPEVLPNVLQFVDQTGTAAPRYWIKGQPPADLLDHPVVGICWYEANAFAMWAAKRLPTSSEWQRAATWSKSQGCLGREPRYPWGDAFDPRKANTWSARRRGTVAVSEFGEGATPNGVRQLIGNVWEWVDAQFTLPGEDDIRLVTENPMAEIRGGAFDTYFHSQATCQFRSGQPLLYRGENVGFRCCVSQSALPSPPQFPRQASESVHP